MIWFCQGWHNVFINDVKKMLFEPGDMRQWPGPRSESETLSLQTPRPQLPGQPRIINILSVHHLIEMSWVSWSSKSQINDSHKKKIIRDSKQY